MTRQSWLARPKSHRTRKAPAAGRKLRIEALEDRAVPAAPVIDPIPDLTATSNQAVRLIPVTAADPDGDELTYSVRSAGTEAYFLSTDLKLRGQSARPTNWGGQGERWLQGKSGWYFITPSGAFHEWDGSQKQASGPQLATLSPAYFLAPDLLTKPQDANLAYVLDKRFGLTPTPNPAINTLGLGERWMTGTGGARYFLTPTGDLYRATGSPLGSVRTLVAQLEASYSHDIRLLTSAKPHRLPVSTLGSVVRIGEVGGTTDDFVVQVTASDGAATARQSFAVKAVGGVAPVIPEVGPQVLGVGEQTLSLAIGATDADGDALTYTTVAAGSDAYFFGSDLGLRNANRPVNWGGEGERWFLSQAGDWYFLKPSGDFHRWDGALRQASGAQLAVIPPAYFHYPDLLTRPQQQDLAYVLDQRFGLTPAGDPAPNSLGQNEKWLAGRGGSRFFLTPDGGFYRQAGGSITWMADLGAGYYKSPDRLYAAPRDRFDAAIDANGNLNITTRPNFLGRFAVRVAVSDGVNTTTQTFPVAQSDFVSPAAPRVVGAVATTNRTVTVSFSQPMNNAATNPANYSISNSGAIGGPGGVAFLGITGARFLSADRTAIELTTLSQSDVVYTMSAVNVRDLGGTALAPATVSGGVVVDPSKSTFGGRPPTLADLSDTDNDGLLDHEEQRGWEVRVKVLNGTTVSRWVTSDPNEGDSDADGLGDAQESNLRLDPRDRDSDDDQLIDFAEFNEIFSDAASQDTDGDTLDDSLEFNFFRSSPVEPDTDGDQLADNVEIVLGNRNPRIADVPKPGIAVGAVDLRLDVRFTATSTRGTSRTEIKSVSSTLTQTEKTEVADMDANTNEFTAKVGVEQGWKVGTGTTGAEGKVEVEAGYTGQFSSSFTETSSEETQEAVTDSFETNMSLTQEDTVQREVVGASMKVGLSLKTLSNIAFTIKNLQVTAFLQDPTQAGRLLPIATLVPEVEPPDGFTLGPLVPERGPFVFASDQIFPALVQDLMVDPRGLVFKVANFDLTDERGRNFAFSSQEINDRTAPIIIDFGFGDGDVGPGLTTERYRVATSAGRVAVDTNGNGTVGAGDRPVVFDPNTGKAVGITVGDAMEGIIGLTHYDEADPTASSLSPLEQDSSYSTKVVNGVERLWRVRGVSRDTLSPLRNWTVFTSTGIDASTDFRKLILRPEGGLTIKFLQDLDNDGIEAAQEYVLGSSDTNTDTDADGLSDNFEFTGRTSSPADLWIVEVQGRDLIRGYSSPARADSDLDGISDADEYNRLVDHDNNTGTPDIRRSLDARNPDSDGDGVSDFDEVNGYAITLRFPEAGQANPIFPTSDPLNPDSDGDTLRDGDEQTLGTDPTVSDGDKVLDNDADGLVNFLEDAGWAVTTFGVSTVALEEGATTTSPPQTSDKNDQDSDNDGLNDREEYTLGTNPNSSDTDGDGVSDVNELNITVNPDATRTITLRYDPRDADLDDDLRSDGDELTVPIWVYVVGETPYPVESDPAEADEDNDTLVDGEELRPNNLSTDPKLFDTDEDNPGIGDARERDLGTNPLVKDQKVRLTLTQVALSGYDGEDGAASNNALDIFGSIKVGKVGAPETVKTYSDSQWRVGHVDPLNIVREYIMTTGDVLRVEHTGFYDDDAVGSLEDDFFTDASKEIAYRVTGGPDSITSQGQGGTGDGGHAGSSIVTSFNLAIVF